MRLARRLTSFAMFAISAMALAAPLAFAQSGEPELHNQTPRLLVAQEVHAANDVVCPAVTPTPPPNPGPLVTAGGCRGHYSAPNVVRSVHLSAGGTEVVISTCNAEFDIRLDAAGEGYLAHQEFTQGTQGTCTWRACGQVTPPTSEGRAYTVYLQETEVVGQGPREGAVILFCFENIDGTGASHCEVTVPMNQTATHRYQFNANDVSGHGVAFPHCELTGLFTEEVTLGTTGEGQLEQRVEIRHT
ncbi:MAG TPA: hypothetical protein VEX36_11440 [Thermoleophilaceae bacterium]|nr:hypothetical protein [Thermoleophilaceae bacterium]